MKIFGQDTAILLAMGANILSWVVRTFAPSMLPKLLPQFAQEDEEPAITPSDTRTRCIVIGRPGGIEQLRLVTLKPGVATVGYNVPGQPLPFTHPLVQDSDIPPDCVVIRNEAFGVNYADVCIRWGLYESAKEYVGYPIVPGFDCAGVVEKVGSQVTRFQKGDRVFGCSLFGSYSSRVLIPELQLRKIPKDLSMQDACALPTVALTALYALFLAGHYPTPSKFNNKAILIHSAAGGVGSMLVQMSKVLGLSPIVGVVGRTAKVDAAKALGCDVVIDKSQQDLWEAAKAASPNGYATVMESSGVATLQKSYDSLAMTGRLVTFGFHTNLPMGKDSLSPLEWLKMAAKMQRMPKFDPMEMGQSNKALLGFNLSFFASEREMLSGLFDSILQWLDEGKIHCPRVVAMNMDETADAHDLIQSGTTVGKLVLNMAIE